MLIDVLKSFSGTLVIATHDLEAVLALASRVIILRAGEVLHDGETVAGLSDRELMASCDLEVPLSLRVGPIRGE